LTLHVCSGTELLLSQLVYVVSIIASAVSVMVLYATGSVWRSAPLAAAAYLLALALRLTGACGWWLPYTSAETGLVVYGFAAAQIVAARARAGSEKGSSGRCQDTASVGDVDGCCGDGLERGRS